MPAADRLFSFSDGGSPLSFTCPNSLSATRWLFCFVLGGICSVRGYGPSFGDGALLTALFSVFFLFVVFTLLQSFSIEFLSVLSHIDLLNSSHCPSAVLLLHNIKIRYE